MCSIISIVLLLIAFSNATLAKNIWYYYHHWSDNDIVHLGNTNCGQDIYHFINNTCDGNARIRLGDDVPGGCIPPTHVYHGNIASGNCQLFEASIV